MERDHPESTELCSVVRWVPVDQGRLFVRDWQPSGHEERASILLLHDSLGCVELWREFPALLAARTGRRVVAYDRLGFGRSDAATRPLSLDFVSTEGPAGMEPVLDALGLDHWVGFGHSVGGGMAIGAAGTVRGCVATITEAAQAFVEQRTVDGIRDAREGFARPGQVERLERYHGTKARWVLDAWTETWLDPGFATWSLDGPLAAVTNPVLAMHGELDEYGSLAHPERIARFAAAPVQVAALPGIHHVPHREAADEVLDLVGEFLAPLI